MERSRRDRMVLGALLLVAAVLGYRAWRGTAVAPTGAARAAGPNRARNARTLLQPPDVHLQALGVERPAPPSGGRDLFRFVERPVVPDTPRRGTSLPDPDEPTTAHPTGEPPAGSTVIGLKFIGLVEAQDSEARIAILSDGRGAPLYGREGDTIAGRFRILRIGTESIEMAYLDGRGRQTIRLSGS